MIMAIVYNFWWVMLAIIFTFCVVDALIERYCKDKERARAIVSIAVVTAIFASAVFNLFHALGCI